MFLEKMRKNKDTAQYQLTKKFISIFFRKLHNFNLWKRSVFEKSTYHPYLDNNNFNADEILQRILLKIM